MKIRNFSIFAQNILVSIFMFFFITIKAFWPQALLVPVGCSLQKNEPIKSEIHLAL
jgi:hypothetical protein